ncbi:MAG: hypothetical protein ACREN6_11100 [Gemmatimonadaceae bacterium]
MRPWRRAAALIGLAWCSASPRVTGAQGAAGRPPAGERGDTTARGAPDGLIPAGFGTLRQDQIAIRVQALGLTVSAIPLEEGVIRTLAPDSYRSLHALRESRTAALAALAARNGLAAVQAWYVTFFNVQQGEARFDAFDFVVRSAGQDFRPLDALPLTPGFGGGRVAQRGQQSAIYAFNPQLDLNQPFTVATLGQKSTVWGDATLPLVERERSAVWSRAAAGKPR